MCLAPRYMSGPIAGAVDRLQKPRVLRGDTVRGHGRGRDEDQQDRARESDKGAHSEAFYVDAHRSCLRHDC